MRGPRPALVVLVASGAVVAAGVAVIAGSTLEPDTAVVESIGQRPTAVTSAPPPLPAAQDPIASPSDAGTAGAASAVATVSPPSRIVIPAIGVDTDIVSVGLDRANAVVVPEDIRRVGWYRHAAAPGTAQGSAVLVAHRDGREQGKGVFYDLGLLDLGDRVVVTTQGGDRVRYRVVARELLQKSAFGDAAPDLFAIDGDARLTLISCGGYYDPNAGGYQANIVVTAIPDDA